MNHLVVSQNSNLEILGNSSNTIGVRIIEKLYELAHAGLDSSSSLSGNLQVSKAYRDSVEWLESNTGLNITVVDDHYIRFADPEVLRILLSKNISSDGYGITETDAQTVTRPGDAWFRNTNITSFDEFKYFTNIDHSYVHTLMFRNCTLLESITVPPHYIAYGLEFYDCNSLKSINFEDIYEIGPQCFLNSGIITINATNLLSVGWNSFLNSSVKNVISLGSIDELSGGNFAYCADLETVVLPPTCTNIGTAVFEDCTKLNLINVEYIQQIGSWVFCGCTSLQKVMNFQNLTSYYSNNDVSGFFCSPAAEHIYAPKLSKLNGGYDLNGNNCKGPFIRGGFDSTRTPLVNVLYLRDVTEVETGCFCGARTIKNIVINNVTPPTVTAYYYQKLDLLIDGGASTLASCNLYVPDASVSLYQNHQYWGEFGNRIKPLSLMSKVATRALWDLLTDVQKADTLIEEYM